MSRPAFRVEVYDRNFDFKGFIGNPLFVTVIPKRMMPGMTTVSVPADHRLIPTLLEEGARMWIKDWDTDDHLMSGWVDNVRIQGPSRRATIEFDVVDDFVIFQYILGWVIPGSPIDEQNTAGTNWTLNDDAETVLLTALQENGVERLGLPIDVPESQGRGAQVKGRLRFQTLYDRLLPVEDGAGIVEAGIEVGVQQNPDAPGLKVNVWEPRTITKVITEESGILDNYQLSMRRATISRAVAGGQGEGILRLLRAKADTDLESRLGWKFEAFRDARDSNEPDVMYERIDETLKEGAAVSGMSLTLSETANFIARPGKLWVGDTLPIRVQGQTFTERLQEVTISSTAGGGKVTRSRIGDYNDDPDTRIAKLVRSIGRRLRVRNADI